MIHVIQFNGIEDKIGVIIYSGSRKDVENDLNVRYLNNDKQYKTDIYNKFNNIKDVNIMVCITKQEYKSYTKQIKKED